MKTILLIALALLVTPAYAGPGCTPCPEQEHELACAACYEENGPEAFCWEWKPICENGCLVDYSVALCPLPEGAVFPIPNFQCHVPCKHLMSPADQCGPCLAEQGVYGECEYEANVTSGPCCVGTEWLRCPAEYYP